MTQLIITSSILGAILGALVAGILAVSEKMDHIIALMEAAS